MVGGGEKGIAERELRRFAGGPIQLLSRILMFPMRKTSQNEERITIKD